MWSGVCVEWGVCGVGWVKPCPPTLSGMNLRIIEAYVMTITCISPKVTCTMQPAV